MEELALIISMPLFFLFVWFVMKRLDQFLDGKRMQHFDTQESQSTPCFPILPGNPSTEKPASELRHCKDIFPNAQILFLDVNSLDAILFFMEHKR